MYFTATRLIANAPALTAQGHAAQPFLSPSRNNAIESLIKEKQAESNRKKKRFKNSSRAIPFLSLSLSLFLAVPQSPNSIHATFFPCCIFATSSYVPSSFPSFPLWPVALARYGSRETRRHRSLLPVPTTSFVQSSLVERRTERTRGSGGGGRTRTGRETEKDGLDPELKLKLV